MRTGTHQLGLWWECRERGDGSGLLARMREGSQNGGDNERVLSGAQGVAPPGRGEEAVSTAGAKVQKVIALPKSAKPLFSEKQRLTQTPLT